MSSPSSPERGQLNDMLIVGRLWLILGGRCKLTSQACLGLESSFGVDRDHSDENPDGSSERPSCFPVYMEGEWRVSSLLPPLCLLQRAASTRLSDSFLRNPLFLSRIIMSWSMRQFRTLLEANFPHCHPFTAFFGS